MLDGSTNLHHGVPRSFTGAFIQQNISKVDRQEHEDFHAMAGHLPPDFFVRKIVLSSVDWKNAEGLVLPIGFFRDMLGQLLCDDWRKLYKNGVFARPNNDIRGIESDALKSIHVHSHIAAEGYLNAGALEFLHAGTHIPPQDVGYLNNAMNYFEEESPTGVLNAFLRSSNDKGDIKWSKPLLSSVRRDLLETIRLARPEQMRRSYHDRMEHVLESHRAFLRTTAVHWKPNTADYQSIIERNYRQPAFSAFLKQSA